MRLRLISVLAVVVLATAAGCGGPDPDGPIYPAGPHGWSNDFPVGYVFTDGFESLEIQGNKPLVLDSVEMVGAKGMKMLGVKMRDPQRRGSGFDSVPGWPPRFREFPGGAGGILPGAVVPAIGATLQPDQEQSYELIIGIKITKPGIATREGIRVNYHIGDQRYTWFDAAHIWICTSPKYHKRGRCRTGKL